MGFFLYQRRRSRENRSRRRRLARVRKENRQEHGFGSPRRCESLARQSGSGVRVLRFDGQQERRGVLDERKRVPRLQENPWQVRRCLYPFKLAVLRFASLTRISMLYLFSPLMGWYCLRTGFTTSSIIWRKVNSGMY